MRGTNQIPSSEITPPSVYLNRRAFMSVGIAAASLVTTGWVYRRLNRAGSAEVDTPCVGGRCEPHRKGLRASPAGFASTSR